MVDIDMFDLAFKYWIRYDVSDCILFDSGSEANEEHGTWCQCYF